MTTKIRKWGNSYAVRVPKALAHKLGVRDGSAINFKIEPVHRKPTLNELLDQIRPENIHPLIDGGPDVGNEIWEYQLYLLCREYISVLPYFISNVRTPVHQ